MASYTLALLTLIRLCIPATNPGAPSIAASLRWVGHSRKARTALTGLPPISRAQLAATTAAGTLLGLALAAFYIIPAAYQRRFVQINMAILPGLHPQDNFLFHHTLDADHDQVLRTASIIAVILILLTITSLLLARIRTKTPSRNAALLTSLAILTLTITLLLTPLSAPVWHHLPELRFLQFPWRLLAILAPTLSLTLALALSYINLKPLPTTLLSIAIAASLTYPAYAAFHQPCDPEDTVAARLAHFRSSNPASEPTDEYTPITADNDALAPSNPPYWLADTPEAPAPSNSQSGPTPTHFSFKATQPGFLILNLRDYPFWDVASTDPNSMSLHRPDHIHRDDGLIALPLYYAADYTIDITYTRQADETIGLIITVFATLLLFTLIAYHRNKQQPPITTDLSSP